MSGSAPVRENGRRGRADHPFCFCHVGGDLAGFTVYRLQRDRYAFTHTEIDPRFSGGGLASILVRETLDEMRRREMAVLPYCPFVRRYISRHLEYLDLVPADAREEFDLPQT